MPHQAVQQQRRVLGDLVVLDEELLELVDDQQDARHAHARLGLAEAVQVLHAGVAELVAAISQLGVQPLQHAQAELALALDGDDPGMRQLGTGVGLELDALLEVDQIQLDLVGAVHQGQVGDQGVQQRRFARAGLAGDQHVLGRALAQLEALPLGGPGPAQRHIDARGGCRRPPVFVAAGAMKSNGTSTRLASLAACADLVHDPAEAIWRGRRLRVAAETFRNPRLSSTNWSRRQRQLDGVLLQVGELEPVGQRLAWCRR